MASRKLPTQVPLVPLLGAVLLVVVVGVGWWAAGAWVADESLRLVVRLLLVAFVLAVAGAAVLVGYGRASVEGQDPLGAARAEIAGILGRAARASGRPFPWPWRPEGRRTVILLGARDSGKTRLLRAQGGMIRALDGSGGLPGELPTSSIAVAACGDVVVVDTAGRLLDGGPQDADEWGVLLDRLRRDLRLPAVTAVAVVVPAPVLAARGDAERLALADRLGQRLAEVVRRLRTRPALHLVVSQVDQLAGFGALAASLDAADRARPLGRRLDATSAGGDAVRRGVATAFDSLRRALDRAVQERLGGVRGEALRADLLALPAEVGALERGVGDLLHHLAASSDARGVWLVGETTPGRVGTVAADLARALAVEPVRSGRAGAFAGPAFATGLVEQEIGRGAAAGTAAWASATRRRTLAAATGAAAVVLLGGLVMFGVARRELRHLDALRGGLQALAEVEAATARDPSLDPWPGTVKGAAVVADALLPEALERIRARDLAADPAFATARPDGPTSLLGLASGPADDAAVRALARAVDRSLLGEARAELVRRAEAAAAGLAGADLSAERLGRAETEAMLLALDTHELAAAWDVVTTQGFVEDPALCGVPSLGRLAQRTAGLRPTGDAAVDIDAALLLAARIEAVPVAVPPPDAATTAAFARLGRVVEGLRPEVRTFNGLLARVGAAAVTPVAGQGLDAGTWPAEALAWRPDALDAPGCVAFHDALTAGASGTCASSAADPARVAAIYAGHHEDQWRTWLSHLALADVNDRPDESPTELAAEIRRVFGPGRELDLVLGRLGQGLGEAESCAAEAPPASCCACACAERPWALATQLAAGGNDAWGALQKSADALAAALDGMDGAKAAPIVKETLQGTGPFVALHDAMRRVVTTVVATPPALPPGCTCEGAPSPLAEAEVRARIETLVTAALSRAWFQTLRRYDEHLHALWKTEVLSAWAPIGGRFPLDLDATDEAPPADVLAVLGCGGKVGTFLTTHLRPLDSGREPPWGRAATLAWTPEARALLDGFDVLCRRAEASDKPKRVQLGMQYVAGDAKNDVSGMRVTVDGRALSYQFGVALEPLALQRASRVQIEALRGNPPKVKCPRYTVVTGDWPLYRLLARPLVAQLKRAPPYDQKGLAFAPARDTETCGSDTLAPHKLTWSEEADGPAAILWSLSTVGVPERVFTVEAPR